MCVDLRASIMVYIHARVDASHTVRMNLVIVIKSTVRDELSGLGRSTVRMNLGLEPGSGWACMHVIS